MPQLIPRDQDGAILTCAAIDCSFNREFACVASAVTVGRGSACCDTYTHRAWNSNATAAMVTTCMTTMCEFNRNLRCTARGVTFDRSSGRADCATFRT